MTLAPIALSTYSRLLHLKQTIEALKANTLAKESNLYIFSDAAKPGDEEKVDAIRKYIDTINGFKNVHVIKRTENSRVRNNRDGIVELLEKYGKCIFLEEDIVTAQGFLSFMNESLNVYEKEEKIFSISGYSPPIVIPADYSPDIFILRRASAWGMGIWHDKFKKISYLDNAEVLGRFSINKEVEELSKYGEDLLEMIISDAAGKIDALDVKIFYYQFVNNKLTVYPRKSLVSNIGHDGSGIHCPKSNRFDVELWEKKEFEITGHVELDERIVKSNYKFRQIGRAHNSMKRSNLSISENISEKDNLGENLIFLISLPRSGSTLLQRLLAGHPDIHTTAEPWIMLHPLYALKNSGITSEFGSNFARQGLEDFISQVPEQQLLYIQALRQMGNMLYSRVLEEAGKRIFLDKTPRYYFIIHELKQVFPKAKFIILFRNPLSVLSSTLKTWFKNDSLALKKDKNYFDLINGPQYLIQGILHLNEKAIVVKYEELVREPAVVLKEICRKLGLFYQEEMLNYGSKAKPKGRLGDPVGIYEHSHPVTDNINKWQENISSIELVEFAEQYLTKLGPDIVSNIGYNFEDLKNKLESQRQLCENQKEKHKKVKNLNRKGEVLLKNSEFAPSLVRLRDANNFDQNNIDNQKNLSFLKYQKRDKKNAYKSILSKKTKQCISAESFASFTYSKNSHFSCFKNNDVALYNKKIIANDCDLKVYQDLLVYSFILENVSKGAKILEIGGGESRVLNAIKDEYECWNIDKLEGRGSGPISVNASEYSLVKAYIGEFSEALPDKYFDFVFSISVLEHVGDGEKLFQNICYDIDRVLKPGGFSLHCFDIIIKRNEVWTNNLLLHMFQKYETINSFIPLDEIKYDKDLYYMSRQAYVRGWEKITKKPYEEFGRPVSYNILWQKQDNDLFCNKSISIGNVEDNSIDTINENKHEYTEAEINRPIIHHGATAPKISIITPSYNQCEFIEECIDSILSQNYPNLEYIIMDGGSIDGSVEIIKKYEKHLAFWRSEPDAGQYDAINQGFKRSSGQILAWLNSDDKYHEDSLLKAAYIFNQYPSVEWITGRPTAWKENGDLAWVFDPLPVWDRKTYLKEAFKKYYIQQESTFWRATLWQKAGARLRTDLKFAGDLELWLRFFRYEKLYTVDTILGGYRHQRNQKTKINMEKYIAESDQVVRHEIANIQKGKFSSMLNAPSPILIDAHDFNSYKQGSLPFQEKGEVSPGRKGQRDHISFQPPNEASASLDMPQDYLGTGQDSAFTIATSIAPHEIELQIQALESWRNFGFDVVSINSQAEIDLLQEFFPKVIFVRTSRNGNRKFGKPYVYFDDFLEYFRSIDSDICGIVNSDIHLIHDKGIVPYILKEAKNSMVYGSRVDIESLNHLSGKFYDDGFDFFFFHKSLLSCFPKSETFIGVTWWDFWAPLIPALKGFPIKKLASPFAYHISHSNRWDEKQWDYMGKHISDYLYRQRDKLIANQNSDTPWAIFDAIHSNATHLYFIDQDLSPEEKAKISYQKIKRVALSISTFLKKISLQLQYNGLPQSFNIADCHGDLGTYDLNKSGEVLLEKGDLEGACRCFSMTLEKDPNFSRAHTNAGVSYSRLGDAIKALQHFKTALEIDPSDRIATLFWAKALIELHLNEATRNFFSSYLFKNPGDLVIGKLLHRLENGDDLSKLIDLEIDTSLKASTSKVKDVMRSDDTYRIGYDYQKVSTLVNCAIDDAAQKPPSLETDSKIDSINKIPLKEGIVGSSCLKAMPLTQTADIGLIQKKFLIKSIPNNKEGLIEVNEIEGFLAENDIIQLYSIAYDLPKNGRIIEIGSYLGLSTHVMAQALIDSQNHGACIYCIDDWVAADSYFKQNGGQGNAFDAFRSNLKRVGVDKYIQIVKKKSLDAVDEFLNDSVDLVFLDGDHSFEGCYADLGAWYPKIKPKGILVGHDYADYFEGIPRAVQIFVNEKQLDSGFTSPPKGSSIFKVRKPQTDAGITGVCSYPLISVITPSYNQAQFLEQTIQSVLDQGYENFEHIVIDGGSTDGTIEILKKYPHLKWVSEKDSGQAEALNKGLKLAQGDIIAWINSDDWYEPGTFEVITSFFKTNPTKNVVMGNCNLADENGIIFDKVINDKRGFVELKKYWIGRSVPTQPAVFFRKKLLDQHGYIDETLHYAMDYDLWLRFAQNSHFYHLDITVANYRFHQAAKGGDQDWNKFVPEWKLVSERYTKLPESTPLVSVIIPCYNYGNYLREAVESVIDQTYKDFEIIIVNDGSHDNTQAVAENLIVQYPDHQIRLISQENSGQPAISRNRGIADAKGQYILCLDGDDMILPTMLEKCLNLLEQNENIAIAYTDRQDFDGVGQVICAGDYNFSRLKYANQISYCALFRKEVWKAIGGYRLNIKGCEDWDFWIAAGSRGYFGRRIPEPLFKYRRHDTGVYQEVLKSYPQKHAQIVLNNSESFELSEISLAKKILGTENREVAKAGVLVSVIVPTFNRPHMLKEAIGSILSQTYRDFEIIVVNDCGKDISELIQNFQDPRIKSFQHKKNMGLAAARNTGIKNASGRFIALLDDDDIFFPEHLEIAIKSLSKKHRVIYTDAVRASYERCGGTYKLLKKNVPYSIDFDRNKLLIGNISPVNCFVFDKNLAFKAGLFDETLSTLEDWEFWIRLSAQIPFKHVAQPTVQVNWRNDGTTMTSSLGSEFKKNRERIYSKYQNEINQIPNKNQIYKEFQNIWAQDRLVKSPLTSIIILTHNELELTKKCVNSIVKHTAGAYEIIFVDNGSSDKTCDYLTALVQRHQNFNLIANSENKGFAAGNNQGIEVARGDYILLINNDLVVTPGWIERMVSCAERDPRIGIVGPMSNSVSGPQLVKDVTYNTTDLDGLDNFACEFSKRNVGKAKRFMRVVGFCMLIKRSVIDKIGGLDSRYGLGNFEDDDFSLRAALAGFESWMAQDCFIHHFGNRTFIGAKIDYNASLTKNWEIFKNKWGFPSDLQLGSKYNWAQILKMEFDREKHCCPLNQRNYTKTEQEEVSSLLSDVGLLKERYQELQRLVNDGRQEEAIGGLERLLEMDPDFAMAHNDLGVLHYNQGNKERALGHYEQAARIEPHNLTYQKNLADFYFVEAGRVEDALAIYNKVLERDFGDVETLMAMGLICASLNRPEDARHFYNRVLEHEPWNADASRHLENLYPN